MNKEKLNFQPCSRITNKEDFTRVFDNAQRVELQDFILYLCPGRTGRARLGTIIAKKKLRSSVLRNKLRRIIKESFRSNQNHIPKVDVVVVPKRSVKNAKFSGMSKALGKYWTGLQSDAC